MHAAQKTGDVIMATTDPKIFILLLALPQPLYYSTTISSGQDSSLLTSAI